MPSVRPDDAGLAGEAVVQGLSADLEPAKGSSAVRDGGGVNLWARLRCWRRGHQWGRRWHAHRGVVCGFSWFEVCVGCEKVRGFDGCDHYQCQETLDEQRRSGVRVSPAGLKALQEEV